MTAGPRPIDRWLKEAFLDFFNQLPLGIAEFRVHEESCPGVFEAEIIPKAQGAASIKVLAEEGDLEAMIAFGRECQTDARYYPNEPMAEEKFKQEVHSICKAISTSNWQERIVRRGEDVVKSEAFLPPPIGHIRIIGIKPFSFRSLKQKTEEIITWEPYWSKD